MSRLFLACLLAITPGCMNLRAASSGEVGCPESEVTISEDSGAGSGSRTWIAECRGRIFYCSAHATGEKSSQYSCTESADSADAEPGTPSTHVKREGCRARRPTRVEIPSAQGSRWVLAIREPGVCRRELCWRGA